VEKDERDVLNDSTDQWEGNNRFLLAFSTTAARDNDSGKISRLNNDTAEEGEITAQLSGQYCIMK
jgi:hypothetical protein